MDSHHKDKTVLHNVVRYTWKDGLYIVIGPDLTVNHGKVNIYLQLKTKSFLFSAPNWKCSLPWAVVFLQALTYCGLVKPYGDMELG